MTHTTEMASPSSHNAPTIARARQSGERFLGLTAFLFSLLLGISGGYSYAKRLLIIAFAVVGIALIVYSFLVKLVVSATSLCIRTGPLERCVSLVHLQSISWGQQMGGTRGSKHMIPVYAFRDDSGRQLRFPINRFMNDDVWAPRVLSAAEGAAATIDPRVRHALESADGTVRRSYE
jgi:hypothetical protein